ncbi:MAG: hypothetical protein AB8F65_08795 [Woeseiaceae bacterium]
MRRITRSFLVLIFISVSLSVSAETSSNKSAELAVERQELIPLDDALDAVTRKTDHKFIVAPAVPAKISVGRVSVRDLEYADLLQVLWLNRLAAITNKGLTQIIPAAVARSMAAPIIKGEGGDVADGEWVTRLVSMKSGQAQKLVPMLRPLMPSVAHLAATPDGKFLVIADLWSNVKRIEALALEIQRAE